ncbi:hypothetical protein [Allostreptomyces psammosilenae]|uniref:Uncharacterized protein n=1 Tax=Allostreptomyces psammosilenae TaxID=1892865 RepID=A0A852ZS99_9ACTN|nr:hypothetical protein [Allostreptomyces psammosilenae]NYI05263.1 hypothetical protein [Allostreptomyces psammosilenae]
MSGAEGGGEVTVELISLRRTVEVGFTRIDGQLALLVQRSDRTDREIEEHDRRISSLERSRWPLPALGALTGIAGAVAALLALIQG